MTFDRHGMYLADDGKLEEKARDIRGEWFSDQSPERQDEIIRPHFEAEYPTNRDKREATKKYGKQA